MEKRLFLVCPDAHLETILPTHFPGESYFMTALGCVFSPLGSVETSGLLQFIERERPDEICLVVSTSCRFIRNVVTHQPGFGTRADQALANLYQRNASRMRYTRGAWNKCLSLASLHLANQKAQLVQNQNFIELFRHPSIAVKTYLYFPKEDRLEETGLPQREKAVSPVDWMPGWAGSIAVGRQTEASYFAKAAQSFTLPPSLFKNRRKGSGFAFPLFLFIAILFSMYNDGLFIKELMLSGGIALLLYFLGKQPETR